MRNLADPTLAYSPDYEPQLLKLSEVQERLALSPSAVKRLVWSGQLPSLHLGRVVRVRMDDLVAFIESQSSPTRQPPQQTTAPGLRSRGPPT